MPSHPRVRRLRATALLALVLAVAAALAAGPAAAGGVPVRRPVPGPPPTGPTTPAPPSRPIWDADLTRSGLTRFETAPSDVVGAPPPVLVASTARPGTKALQVSMPGGGNRAEVVPETAGFSEGDDRWFGFSFVLPPGFPTGVTSWQLLTQWKNEGTGSPPLEITVGRGNLRLSGGYGHPAGPRRFEVPLTSATVGVRIDLAVHIVFSRDPARGSIDVWRDGAPVLTGYHPAGGTLYPAGASGPASRTSLGSYWKMGLYRDPEIRLDARYTIESARVGTSAAAVAP